MLVIVAVGCGGAGIAQRHLKSHADAGLNGRAVHSSPVASHWAALREMGPTCSNVNVQNNTKNPALNRQMKGADHKFVAGPKTDQDE